MTILDFLALALQIGDKVHIRFNYSGEDNECDAYFGGFRRYENRLIRDFLDIFPVFYEVNAHNGVSTRRLLRGVSGWSISALQSVRRLSPMKLTPDAVMAVCDLKEMIDKEAHTYLVNFMRDYATCHPGRPKIYLDLDDGVSATLDDKYCSYPGRIIAVSFIDGGLHYDIQTDTDLEKDVPDYRDVSRGGIFVENETMLLKTILNTVESPYYPEYEDFFDFIKRGAEVRWNDVPEYISRMKKPGPLVKVIGIHEFDEDGGPIDENTAIRIKYDLEEPVIIVKAKELEPT